MAENEPEVPVVEVPVEEQDEAVELASLAVDDGKGGKMVPLSALIGSKKTQRELQKRIKELEPVAARATEIEANLGRAQPIINAILNNPKLQAEATRIAGGTRATAETVEQPDDPDLVWYAEEHGFFLSDGVTPDAARAGRIMARMDARNGKQTDERIRPLAGITLSAKADENIRAAMAATDEDGNPWATRESIEEVVKQLPRNLLADANVSNLILTNAIGVDRMKKRTPKAPDEPVFLERHNGGGRQRESVLGSDERAFLKASGITEEQYRKTSSKLEQGAANRRGIVLGED